MFFHWGGIMKIIGITGNSGSGKSTIAKIIKKQSQGMIIDADKIAKNMTTSNTMYLKEIANTFGTEVVKNNQLNRQKLADIVFNNAQEKEKLDKITFQYVVDEIKRQINSAKENIVILDVPLLFESKLNELCDYTVGVIANENEKIERICKRDCISKEKAMQRINSQPNDEFYVNNCDYIIRNSNPKQISAKVNELLIKLQ